MWKQNTFVFSVSQHEPKIWLISSLCWTEPAPVFALDTLMFARHSVQKQMRGKVLLYSSCFIWCPRLLFGLPRLAHRNHLPILIELRQCIRGHPGVGSHWRTGVVSRQWPVTSACLVAVDGGGCTGEYKRPDNSCWYSLQLQHRSLQTDIYRPQNLRHVLLHSNMPHLHTTKW